MLSPQQQREQETGNAQHRVGPIYNPKPRSRSLPIHSHAEPIVLSGVKRPNDPQKQE